MAQIISIEQNRHGSMKPSSHRLAFTGARSHPLPSPPANHLTVRESIYRMILLLDSAAEDTRQLVKKITDPSRRQDLEAQITTIEHSIQFARDLALKL